MLYHKVKLNKKYGFIYKEYLEVDWISSDTNRLTRKKDKQPKRKVGKRSEETFHRRGNTSVK